MLNNRIAKKVDYTNVIDIWSRSVKATHHFISKEIKVVKCLFDRFEDLITRIIYILIGLFVVIESGLLEKMLFLLAPILKIIYF